MHSLTAPKVDMECERPNKLREEGKKALENAYTSVWKSAKLLIANTLLHLNSLISRLIQCHVGFFADVKERG
jgi:hypothetical protein